MTKNNNKWKVACAALYAMVGSNLLASEKLTIIIEQYDDNYKNLPVRDAYSHEDQTRQQQNQKFQTLPMEHKSFQQDPVVTAPPHDENRKWGDLSTILSWMSPILLLIVASSVSN